MRVSTLKITNLRALHTATFTFQSGFNLIVGVNGVGKTTVLDALSGCLRGAVTQLNNQRYDVASFDVSDVRIGSSFLAIECAIDVNDEVFTYLIYEPRNQGALARSGAGKPREQTHETKARNEFLDTSPRPAGDNKAAGRPLAVLFSTRRAVAISREARQRRAPGGIAAAYVNALADRELDLTTFAEWMRAQVALSNERPRTLRVLEAFERATSRFLPGYTNLRATNEPQPRLLIDQGERVSVQVSDLSDHERSSLEQALEWADDQMKLHWRDDPDMAPNELARASAQARKKWVEEGVERFLSSCSNLRANDDGEPNSLIDRLPPTLDVRQLSDGERGILAMVLDITRRLAQANPHMEDPAAEAEAVILIDEIDLHLHPRWQREVIHNLTAAFPKCQFIATTHSPQVIGEMDKERVQIMTRGQVYSPTHSYGVDSSRLLEEVMDTTPRNREVQELLGRLSELVAKHDFESAQALLEELSKRLGDSDPEVTRARTLIDFMEGGA